MSEARRPEFGHLIVGLRAIVAVQQTREQSPISIGQRLGAMLEESAHSIDRTVKMRRRFVRDPQVVDFESAHDVLQQ